jgi:hypothetical protein
MMHSLNWLEELEEMNNKKQNIEEVFENNLSIQTRIRCMPPKNITTNHVLQLQSCDPWKKGNSHSRKRKICRVNN